MTNNELLLTTIGSVLEVPGSDLNDLSSPDTIPTWDSLRLVNMVAELEIAFDVQFDILEVADFKNVGIIRSVLAEKGVRFE